MPPIFRGGDFVKRPEILGLWVGSISEAENFSRYGCGHRGWALFWIMIRPHHYYSFLSFTKQPAHRFERACCRHVSICHQHAQRRSLPTRISPGKLYQKSVDEVSKN